MSVCVCVCRLYQDLAGAFCTSAMKLHWGEKIGTLPDSTVLNENNIQSGVNLIAQDLFSPLLQIRAVFS